jgi:Xaa-Pro aminopeptidase
VPASDFRAHRDAALAGLSDGLLLVRSEPTTDGDSSLIQDPYFYYLTGLESEIGSVLVLDGPKKEAWLFVPPRGRWPLFPSRAPAAMLGAAGVTQTGLAHVVLTDSLAGMVDRRLAEQANLVLYTTDNAGAPGADPQRFPPVDDRSVQWARELRARWPRATVRTADTLAQLRQIKGPAEIAALRRVADASAAAFLAGLRDVRPGRRQRLSEVEVVRACVAGGMVGPSFWPWVMSGPLAVFPTPFASLTDYEHLDRTMQAGDLVRIDVGCQSAHYNGDVGRTAPVSGHFDPGQREVWDLFIQAWRTGLSKIRDGASADSVKAAARQVFATHRGEMKTILGQHAVEAVLAEHGTRFWQLHGVGLEGAEGTPPVLHSGMVLAWEPIFSVDGQGFYLEDMVLVTPSGAEVLTKGLPYTSEEIENAMRR